MRHMVMGCLIGLGIIAGLFLGLQACLLFYLFSL